MEYKIFVPKNFFFDLYPKISIFSFEKSLSFKICEMPKNWEKIGRKVFKGHPKACRVEFK